MTRPFIKTLAAQNPPGEGFLRKEANSSAGNEVHFTLGSVFGALSDPLQDHDGMTSRDRYMMLEYYFCERKNRPLSEYLRKWLKDLVAEVDAYQATIKPKPLFGRNVFLQHTDRALAEVAREVLKDRPNPNTTIFWQASGEHDKWLAAFHSFQNHDDHLPGSLYQLAVVTMRQWVLEAIQERVF